MKRTGLVLFCLTGAATLSPVASRAENATARPAMIIDVNRCTGCHIGLSALGSGTNPNMVGRLDSKMANIPLVDVLAGIPDFSSTRVTIEKSF